MPRFITPSPDQIKQWVNNHFPDAKLRRGGNEMIIPNPFAGDDNFKFNISLDKGVVHDWRPHYQEWDGSFLKFVSAYKKISFNDAVYEVCGSNKPLTYTDIQNYADSESYEDEEVEFDIEMPDCVPFDFKTESLSQSIAFNYLKRRGLTIEDVERHFIHYNATEVIFPYVEYGITVYWQARSVTNKIFRFPELPDGVCGKSCYLYGFDQVEPHSTLIITEAIFDAHTLGDGCVATGGAGLSNKQLRKIKMLAPSKIILAPDNDEAGIKSIIDDYTLLSPYFNNISYCIPPQGPETHGEYPWKDWNQFGQCTSWDKPQRYISHNQCDLSMMEIIKLRNYLSSIR